jgi:hypothetical protein
MGCNGVETVFHIRVFENMGNRTLMFVHADLHPPLSGLPGHLTLLQQTASRMAASRIKYNGLNHHKPLKGQKGHCQHYVRTPHRILTKLKIQWETMSNAVNIVSYT